MCLVHPLETRVRDIEHPNCFFIRGVQSKVLEQISRGITQPTQTMNEGVINVYTLYTNNEQRFPSQNTSSRIPILCSRQGRLLQICALFYQHIHLNCHQKIRFVFLEAPKSLSVHLSKYAILHFLLLTPSPPPPSSRPTIQNPLFPPSTHNTSSTGNNASVPPRLTISLVYLPLYTVP